MKKTILKRIFLLCLLCLMGVVFLPFKAYAADSNQTSGEIVSTQSAKYTYKTMEKNMRALVSAYPDILKMRSLGKSFDERNIYEITVGNQAASRHIFVQASMHGREYMNSMLAMKQIEYLCKNYKSGSYEGKKYSELLNAVCIHMIPMTNPDGVSISQSGASAIRDEAKRKKVIAILERTGREAKYWKANGRGVDLNRNFPLEWENTNQWCKQPSTEGYMGPSPASEGETKILMNRVEEVRPKAVLAYHSTGSIIYWNFLQSGTLQKKCRSLYDLVRGMTGYRDAGTSKTGPSFGDWTCAGLKIPTLTIENGVNNCPLSISEWPSIWSKNKNLLPAVMMWTIKPDGTDFKEVEAMKRSISLSWKKVSCDGYQVKYSKNSNMSDATYLRVTDPAQLSLVIRELERKTEYYIRVRSCRKVNGRYFNSDWSPKMKVKTK